MEIKEHIYLTNEEFTIRDILDYMALSGVTSFQRKFLNLAISCTSNDVRDWGEKRTDEPIMNYTLQITDFKEVSKDIENANSFVELIFNSEFEIIECSFQFGMPEDIKHVSVECSSLSDDIYYAESVVVDLIEKFCRVMNT